MDTKTSKTHTLMQRGKDIVLDMVGRSILNPVDEIISEEITGVVTAIGTFAIKKVQDKFQRTITFNIGVSYSDDWMEEALYGILYRYNNIRSSSNLQLSNTGRNIDGSGLYYRLNDGIHNLKYRNYNILLSVSSTSSKLGNGRERPVRQYTVICYNLDSEFIKLFEQDMISNRNRLLKVKADSPFVNVYQDNHEGDGYTYWSKLYPLPKRRIGSIYLDKPVKETIVDTINGFLSSKEYYTRHGITHKLNILLYGAPGTGKDSVARMIASEWNRNIYYVTGGKSGMFIPNALSDNSPDINYPVFMISDIDKYPFLIHDTTIDLDNEESTEEKIRHKQQFQNMINSLDGIKAMEGRILIMTTNHIDKFNHETFLRPGRVDLCLEIGYVTAGVFRKYVYDFYKHILPKDIKLKVENLTIATLQFDVVFNKLPLEEFINKYVKNM